MIHSLSTRHMKLVMPNNDHHWGSCLASMCCCFTVVNSRKAQATDHVKKLEPMLMLHSKGKNDDDSFNIAHAAGIFQF